jgi:hypothetical protein
MFCTCESHVCLVVKLTFSTKYVTEEGQAYWNSVQDACKDVKIFLLALFSTIVLSITSILVIIILFSRFTIVMVLVLFLILGIPNMVPPTPKIDRSEYTGLSSGRIRKGKYQFPRSFITSRS